MPSVNIIGTRGYPSYYGGFETAVRKIAPYLADQGWKVSVYSRPNATKMDDPSADPRVASIVTHGVESRSISTLSFGLTASLHTMRHKPDVALIMNVANGYFLPLLKLRRIRTVVNVDGIEWDRAKWGRFAKAIFKVGANLTARYADTLIFDSLEISRRWAQDFSRDGVYIPYGGDEIGQLPLEPGFKHRGYVLVVARFVPENSIPEFLDAVENVARRIPVIIVGSSGYGGDLETRVAEIANRVEGVTWLGHISDDLRLFSLWQHAGVYFHGHSVGGTNPTLVQAMALGSPIVARDTVYSREVMGEQGRFCAPEGGAIEDAIIGLALDIDAQTQMSEEMLARSRQAYTWDIVRRAYAKVLTSESHDDALGEGHPS